MENKTVEVDVDSKLVAEYVGGNYWAYVTDHGSRLRARIEAHLIGKYQLEGYQVSLAYRTNWNWLMIALKQVTYDLMQLHANDMNNVLVEYTLEALRSALLRMEIDGVFQKVVEGIKVINRLKEQKEG